MPAPQPFHVTLQIIMWSVALAAVRVQILHCLPIHILYRLALVIADCVKCCNLTSLQWNFVPSVLLTWCASWGEPEQAPHWSLQCPTSRGNYICIYLCMWHACSVCYPNVHENTPIQSITRSSRAQCHKIKLGWLVALTETLTLGCLWESDMYTRSWCVCCVVAALLMLAVCSNCTGNGLESGKA